MKNDISLDSYSKYIAIFLPQVEFAGVLCNKPMYYRRNDLSAEENLADFYFVFLSVVRKMRLDISIMHYNLHDENILLHHTYINDENESETLNLQFISANIY